MTQQVIHAPGPWSYEVEYLSLERKQPTGSFIVRAADGTFLCRVAGEANARLVASAACLRDALVDLVERDRSEALSCGFTDDEMSWLEEARRAIAKARAIGS